MKNTVYLLLAMGLFGASNASATGSVTAGVGLFYNSVSEADNSSTTKLTKTYVDFNLGYLEASGLYFGVLYFNDTISNSGSGVTPTFTGYGASIGYFFRSGWFLNGHYIIDSTYDKPTSSLDKWTKGSGYQVDGGYSFSVSSDFSIAAELSYRTVKYTNYNNGSTDITGSSYTRTETFPQMKLSFAF